MVTRTGAPTLNKHTGKRMDTRAWLARGAVGSPRKLTQHNALYLYVYICIQVAVQRRARGPFGYGPGGMGQGAPFLVRPVGGTASAGHQEVGPTSGLVDGTMREACGAGGPALLGALFVGAREGVWGSGESLGETDLERGPLSVVRSSTTSSTQHSRPRGTSGVVGARVVGFCDPLESKPGGWGALALAPGRTGSTTMGTGAVPASPELLRLPVSCSCTGLSAALATALAAPPKPSSVCTLWCRVPLASRSRFRPPEVVARGGVHASVPPGDSFSLLEACSLGAPSDRSGSVPKLRGDSWRPRRRTATCRGAPGPSTEGVSPSDSARLCSASSPWKSLRKSGWPTSRLCLRSAPFLSAPSEAPSFSADCTRLSSGERGGSALLGRGRTTGGDECSLAGKLCVVCELPTVWPGSGGGDACVGEGVCASGESGMLPADLQRAERYWRCSLGDRPCSVLGLMWCDDDDAGELGVLEAGELLWDEAPAGREGVASGALKAPPRCPQPPGALSPSAGAECT